MNFDFPIAEFKTPQKPFYVRSHHKHNSSQPQFGSHYTEREEKK